MANVSISRRGTTKKGQAWQIQIRHDTPTGQVRSYETFYGSETQAKKHARRIEVEIDDGKRLVSSGETFGELMESVYGMAAHRRRGRSKAWTPAGKARVRGAIDCYLNPDRKADEEWVRYLDPPGPRRLDKLTTPWWDAFFGRVLNRKKSGGESAGGSVARLHSIVHAAYEQAKRDKKVVENPVENCTLPDSTRERVRPPTMEELGLLFGVIEATDPAFYTFCYLAADLGQRRGEGCAFRWGDIDLDEGTIGVGARLSVGVDGPVLLQHTKARDQDSPRRSLTAETVVLLTEHKERLRVALAKLEIVQGPQSWVFPRMFEGRKAPLIPWRPEYVTKRFTFFRRQVNLDQIRFHDLRHLVATEMLTEGRDAITVANRLGNSPATVMSTYAHWRKLADQEAVLSHGRKLAALKQHPRLTLIEGAR